MESVVRKKAALISNVSPSFDRVDRGIRVCIPYAQLQKSDYEKLEAESSKIMVFNVSSMTDKMVVAHISFGRKHPDFPQSIKGRISKKTSARWQLEIAQRVLAPFVGHRGPIYPSDPLQGRLVRDITR